MTYSLRDAILLLGKTPQVLRALLSDLPAAWVEANEGHGTWNAMDILGHLIHGEKTDWIPRARLILEHGDSRTFDPFDMRGHERERAGRSLSALLNEFQSLRQSSIQALADMNLSSADLDKEGTHPEFGRVALRQHLATWVAHDMTHICQIARVIAKQYKHEVGPWSAYLGILNDRQPPPPQD